MFPARLLSHVKARNIKREEVPGAAHACFQDVTAVTICQTFAESAFTLPREAQSALLIATGACTENAKQTSCQRAAIWLTRKEKRGWPGGFLQSRHETNLT